MIDHDQLANAFRLNLNIIKWQTEGLTHGDSLRQPPFPADLSQEIEAGQRTTTMAQRLFGLYFHETYHTGQTELLRQLAGMDDRVI